LNVVNVLKQDAQNRSQNYDFHTLIMIKSKCKLVTLLSAFALVFVTVAKAQTTDLLLGFNDASGPVAAQNDYVIDLGMGASALFTNAQSNGGTWTFTNIISSSMFTSAFSSDSAALNEVAAGIVGTTYPSATPITIDITAPSTPTSFTSGSAYNEAAASTAGSPTGVYASAGQTASNPGWTFLVAQSPTQPGTDPNGVSLSSLTSNPLGTLNAGTLTLNFYQASRGGSGLHPTAGPFTNTGSFFINVNSGNVTFTYGSSTPPPPTITSVVGTSTNGFAPLTVVFTDTVTGTITNWVWNFGNGNIITNTTGASVTNTYANGGDYTVTLTVYGPGGSTTTTLSNYIIASPAPKIFTSLSAGILTLSGSNCPAGVPYRILTSTNITLKINQWTTVQSSSFTGNGTFSFSTPATNKAGFFDLVSP
jgi:PKD repeat protein